MNSIVCRSALLVSVILGAASLAVSQERLSQNLLAAEADETFDLNIDQRRITERKFHAGTAVGVESADGSLLVEVGVALSAGTIDVSLQNVRGRVHFRGSLARLRDVINQRRTAVLP
jgi:hypothetical protein